MALRRTAEVWAELVSEVLTGELTLEDVARKHGITASSLRYHYYKARPKTDAAPQVLPVRVSTMSVRDGGCELIVGTARLRFDAGCDPAYVAAVVSALSKC
jgi:transposase-like protein